MIRKTRLRPVPAALAATSGPALANRWAHDRTRTSLGKLAIAGAITSLDLASMPTHPAGAASAAASRGRLICTASLYGPAFATVRNERQIQTTASLHCNHPTRSAWVNLQFQVREPTSSGKLGWVTHIARSGAAELLAAPFPITDRVSIDIVCLIGTFRSTLTMRYGPSRTRIYDVSKPLTNSSC